MKQISKIFGNFFLSALIFFAAVGFANAQEPQPTLLPSSPNLSNNYCLILVQDFEINNKPLTNGHLSQSMSDVLACAIETGKISLSMVPFFIQYIANWMLGMIGIVCVIFIMVGGFQYIYGGLVDQKEVGKKYVENALKGMSVAILAWVIVNVVMAVVTG